MILCLFQIIFEYVDIMEIDEDDIMSRRVFHSKININGFAGKVRLLFTETEPLNLVSEVELL